MITGSGNTGRVNPVAVRQHQPRELRKERRRPGETDPERHSAALTAGSSAPCFFWTSAIALFSVVTSTSSSSLIFT